VLEASEGTQVPGDAEVPVVSGENERLTMERDIVKKATAFFARESE
jgi:transposase-like protein